MAYRIEVKGPAKYLLVGVLILLFAGHRLAPDLLAGLVGSGGSSWACCAAATWRTTTAISPTIG